MTVPSEESEEGDWSAKLFAAENHAPRVAPRPLSLEAIESRGRRQRTVQASWAAAAMILLFMGWAQARWLRSGGAQAPAPASIPNAQRALGNLEESLAAGPQAPTQRNSVAAARARADAAIERALTTEFRANYMLAEAGDLAAWVNLQQLYREHPDSHGGRSARAYLASNDSINRKR